jgi:hypothetical protein
MLKEIKSIEKLEFVSVLSIVIFDSMKPDQAVFDSNQPDMYEL